MLSKILGNTPQTHLSTFLLYRKNKDCIFYTLPFEQIDNQSELLRVSTKQQIHPGNILGGGVYRLERDVLIFSGESPRFGPVYPLVLESYAQLVKEHLEKKNIPVSGVDISDVINRKVRDEIKWKSVLGNI
ncbi:MAG TPA: hypothetical protein VKE88_01365 [Candidatus Nanoarchaeia archaeon]|nr:hypothetical protein [Candidatus Nanoarchaeia archaeon]